MCVWPKSNSIGWGKSFCVCDDSLCPKVSQSTADSSNCGPRRQDYDFLSSSGLSSCVIPYFPFWSRLNINQFHSHSRHNDGKQWKEAITLWSGSKSFGPMMSIFVFFIFLAFSRYSEERQQVPTELTSLFFSIGIVNLRLANWNGIVCACVCHCEGAMYWSA